MNSKLKRLLAGALVAPCVIAGETWAGGHEAAHGTEWVDISDRISFKRGGVSFYSEGLAGAAWLDYDGDDDLDLYLTNRRGFDNALFENVGGVFNDVAEAAGVLNGQGNSGALAGDVDNDGCVDLFLVGDGGSLGPAGFASPNKLYINNCDGTFTDATAGSGIMGPRPAVMASFGDIDDDGYLDLFVTNPGSFVTGNGPQELYLNNGDRTFTAIGHTAGIDSSQGGCVVNFSHIDADGLIDIIVGNCNRLDFSSGIAMIVPGPWELWLNNGDLTFTDDAASAGLNERVGFPMGLTMSDHDGDGDQDIFATNAGPDFTQVVDANQILFRNNGDGTYTDVAGEAGLGGYEWGWGTSFADFDNDGDEDLITAGSFPFFAASFGPGGGGPGRVFENDGRGRFTLATTFGLESDYTSGLAVGDVDGDGFPDVVIMTSAFFNLTSRRGRPVLLLNEGNGNNSLTVRLVGTAANRDGVGAILTVGTGRSSQTKEVRSGTSFASGNSPWLTFGLGASQRARILVAWPSGRVERFRERRISGNRFVTLVEGQGRSLRD